MHFNSTGKELYREILVELNTAHRMITSLARKLEFINDYMYGSQLDTLEHEDLEQLYTKIRVIEHIKDKL